MKHLNVEDGVKITSFEVLVEAPMHSSIVFDDGINIAQWKNIFIRLRDKEIAYEGKKNYDRCQVILQLADSCGGELKKISNVGSKIVFTITFDSIVRLNTFQEDLSKVVEKATNN